MKESSNSIKKYYNHLAKKYDSLYRDKESKIENEIVSKRLKQICQGKEVLDLGCGTALSLELCNPKKYIGVDISDNMINIAKSKFPSKDNNFIIADLNNGEWLDKIKRKRFDIIISLFSSLSQVTDLENVIDNCYNLLKKDGTFYVMILNKKPFKPFIKKYNIRNLNENMEGLITYFYSKSEIKVLFKRFKEIKIVGLNNLNMLKFDLKSIDYLLGKYFNYFSHTLIIEAIK